MPEIAQSETRSAADVVRSTPVTQAENGIAFALYGDNHLAPSELARVSGAVPRVIAAALGHRAFYFVPLAMTDNNEVRISENYSEALGDVSSCHRNYDVGGSQYVFISTRLSPDKFSVAFEFFINVAHAFVDAVGVAPPFADLAWKQALAGAKGETSLDAHEYRRQALGGEFTANGNGTRTPDERARTQYMEAAFSDALAIYMLSLAIDVEYFELRERDYPLLAPKPLAERLRLMAELFPANPGYEFAIHYRRRGER
ncbi:MAG TPA: hypothetical protein VGC88_06260 [Terriglobales bacterium]|jgi:hypothetical protein